MLGEDSSGETRRIMSIRLRPEHEKMVTDALATGAYQDPDEVIGRALEMLQAEDEWLQSQKGEIAEKIERALGQFERGEFLTAEASRADMEKRKAAWRRDHNR